MSHLTPPHITAVIVTYHPDLGLLSQQLILLSPQVSHVVIVDNGSPCDLASWNLKQKKPVTEILLLGENRGIATAHNTGISWAKNHNSDYVLLMDQDSLPAANMVEMLFLSLKDKPMAAAAGPRYLDERQNNPPPFIKINGLKLVRCTCTSSDSVVAVDYLISSGCLIPMSVLNKVGVMREDFFIDYVDIEWGLRARSHGFQSYGSCGAHMKHNLGENPIIFFGKKIPLHSPLRHYYHFRNAILLYKENWVPLNWKLVDGYRLVLKYVFYSLFTKPRKTHFKMMTIALWDGFLGKAGKKLIFEQRTGSCYEK